MVPSPTRRCSSYWKGSLLVANYYYLMPNQCIKILHFVWVAMLIVMSKNYNLVICHSGLTFHILFYGRMEREWEINIWFLFILKSMTNINPQISQQNDGEKRNNRNWWAVQGLTIGNSFARHCAVATPHIRDMLQFAKKAI